MRKTRAPDLTPELIQVVLETLDSWKGKLTWNLLLAAVEKATDIAYSRFTFAEYPEVANAFSLRKDALRGVHKIEPATPRDERVRAALEQVARIQSTLSRLKQENELLKEQFVTWALNAERKGITMAMLNAPLAKPQRDRTKGAD